MADFGLARKLMDENIYEAHAGAKFPIKVDVNPKNHTLNG